MNNRVLEILMSTEKTEFIDYKDSSGFVFAYSLPNAANACIEYGNQLAVQYGRWLLKNAVSVDNGNGLCYQFDKNEYNNKDLFEIFLKQTT